MLFPVLQTNNLLHLTPAEIHFWFHWFIIYQLTFNFIPFDQLILERELETEDSAVQYMFFPYF